MGLLGRREGFNSLLPDCFPKMLWQFTFPRATFESIVFLHPFHQQVLSLFLIFAHLIGEKWPPWFFNLQFLCWGVSVNGFLDWIGSYQNCLFTIFPSLSTAIALFVSFLSILRVFRPFKICLNLSLHFDLRLYSIF